ncbi:MAG: hypothetical protein QOE54_5878 [Streptosporangiaceae bacterium]|nr:hypothetical protein [Streptosporangiaceae bacterium]
MAERVADEEFDDELVELFEQIVQRRVAQRRTARSTAAGEPSAADGSKAVNGARTGTEPEPAGGDGSQEACSDESEEAEALVSDGADADGEGETGLSDAEDTSEETDAESDDNPSPRRRRIRISATTAVITGLSVALVAVTGVAVMEHLSSGGGERLQVEQRASQVAGTLYSYDYQNVTGYLKAQQDVLTKTAQATVKPNWSSLTTMIQSGKYVSRPQIRQVYVGDVTRSRATVVVVADIKLTTSSGILSSTGATLQFTLAREDGRWLASEIPTLLTPGTQTETDLKGNPIKPSASPSPTSNVTPKS